MAGTYGYGGPIGGSTVFNAVYHDHEGRTSRLHIDRPATNNMMPLHIHLHGDGAYEFKDPTSPVPAALRTIAAEQGAMFVLPRTPDMSSHTWWATPESTRWLANLIKTLYLYYNIDKQRVYITGYSGGAEAISYYLIAKHHDLFLGGGAVLLGGGGASGLTISGLPSNSIKADYLMRWWVGADDDGLTSTDGFNALRASERGEAFYRRAGFNTKRTIIASEDHYESYDDVPRALRSLIAEHRAR